MNPDSQSPPPHWQELPQSTFVPGLTTRPDNHFPRSLTLGELVRIGQRLFDAGFYWEAHEAWEQAWISTGRSGVTADFLKGCIRLAACGVKCLAGNPLGAKRHALRAVQLFETVLTATAEAHADHVPLLKALRDRAVQLTESLPDVTERDRTQATQGGVPILGQLPGDLTLLCSSVSEIRDH